MKKTLRLIFIIILIIVCGFFICGVSIEQSYKEKECTMENVYQAILLCNISNPHVVFAQLFIESGAFKSKLAKNNNNLAGMRCPNKRETTAVGNKNGYAYYLDWFSSITDYFLYQKNLIGINKLNDKQYLAKLSKKYAKDPSYKKKITLKMKRPEIIEFYRVQDSIFNSKKQGEVVLN